MSKQTFAVTAACLAALASRNLSSGSRVAGQGSPPAALVFDAATIIDGTGQPAQTNVTLVIEGDRIRAVGPRGTLSIPPSARVVDARGKTLMPGLADLHTHLQGGWDGDRADMLNFHRYLDALLYNGVTTILDPGNSMPYVTQIRQEIAAGRLRGPRVYCAGPMIDSGDPIWPPLAEPLVSYGQAPRLVKWLADHHVDVIKAYAGLSDLHIRALADEGKKVGLRVIADAWERNGSSTLVRSGIYAFAHAPHAIAIDESLAREMADRHMATITTIVVRESFSNQRLQDLTFMDQPLIKDVIPAHLIEEIRAAAASGAFSLTGSGVPEYLKYAEQTKKNVMTLWRAGVLVAAGTDAPYPGVFQGESLHRELELLVDAGLTPVQAIQAATSNAARFMDGDAADWGTIAPGKRADLLLVSGRPDERISDTRAIVDVVQAGRLLDRAALRIQPGEPAYRTSGPTFHPTAR